MLVEVPRAEGVPAVELGDGPQMYEPVHLQRFVEVARRLRRHVAADIGDLLEFRAAHGIGRGNGLNRGEMSWILEDNLSSGLAVRRYADQPYKEYVTYEKTLEPV